MKNVIIYLIGHYGVGKYTIGKAIAASTDARLFDNHLANNVIFSLVGVNGPQPIPDGMWDLIGVIRDQAFIAIEQHAATDASYVLTNCLIEGNPRDQAAYEKALTLAGRRGSVFVPVMLTASDAAYAKRIGTAERAERYKMTDVAAAHLRRQGQQLISVDHPNRLDINTSAISPERAAQDITAHATRLCGAAL